MIDNVLRLLPIIVLAKVSISSWSKIIKIICVSGILEMTLVLKRLVSSNVGNICQGYYSPENKGEPFLLLKSFGLACETR